MTVQHYVYWQLATSTYTVGMFSLADLTKHNKSSSTIQYGYF